MRQVEEIHQHSHTNDNTLGTIWCKDSSIYNMTQNPQHLYHQGDHSKHMSCKHPNVSKY